MLSEKNIDREQVEKNIRAHLKLDDTETVKAVMEKAERLGFAEKPKLTQFKEYQIERETQSAFTVRLGNTDVCSSVKKKAKINRPNRINRQERAKKKPNYCTNFQSRQAKGNRSDCEYGSCCKKRRYIQRPACKHAESPLS